MVYMLQIVGQLAPIIITVVTNNIVPNRHITHNEAIRDKVLRCATPLFLQIAAQSLGYLTGMAILGISVSPIAWITVTLLAITAISLTIQQNKSEPKIIRQQLTIAVTIFALSLLNTINFDTFLAIKDKLFDPYYWQNYTIELILPLMSAISSIACPALMGTLGHAGHYLYSKNRPLSIQIDPESQNQARVFSRIFTPSVPIPVELHKDPELSKFVCPISQCPIKDPVRGRHIAHIFERSWIVAWLTNHKTNPYDRSELTIDTLVEMPELRKQIEARLKFLTEPHKENEKGPVINIAEKSD